MRRRGFTLIELLIVVAVLGIMAIAVLSAINPLEQMKKARDSGRKSDAAELLNAYERFYTTFGCQPWDLAYGCVGAYVLGSPPDLPQNPGFGVAPDPTNINSIELLNKNELKSQFTTRGTVVRGELWVSEQAGSHMVSVCFEPESETGREGGFGPLMNMYNTAAASCPDSYTGDGDPNQCYVCVPQ